MMKIPLLVILNEPLFFVRRVKDLSVARFFLPAGRQASRFALLRMTVECVSQNDFRGAPQDDDRREPQSDGRERIKSYWINRILFDF